MKLHIAVILSIFALIFPCAAAERDDDRCRVTEVERLGGKPLQVVGRVAVDSTGYLWIGSWGGLHRYDGNEMVRMPSRMRDNSSVISDRFYDMRLDANGNLWCRIDDRLVMFDTSDYTYTDISSRMEKRLGDGLLVNNIDLNVAGDTVHVGLKNGRHIAIPIASPDNVALTDSRPCFTPLRKAITLPAAVISESGVKDVAFAGMLGDLYCVISRDGRILTRRPAETGFTEAGHINASARLLYHDTDINGNLWLGAEGKLFVVTPPQRLFSEISAPGNDGPVRAAMTDSQGRLWIAGDNGENIAVVSPDGETRYVGADGTMTSSYAGFGHRVYSLAEYPDGIFWIGTKPDGLFRLNQAEGLIDRIESTESVYDIAADRYGRLWIASINDGLSCIENPGSPGGAVPTDLSALKSYPRDALRARRIALTDDSIYVATTNGILKAPLPPPGGLGSFAPRLLTARAGDPASPTGPAISDVAVDRGNLLVATESAGFDIASLGDMRFTRLNTSTGAPADVIRSVGVDPGSRRAVVVADDMIFTVDPSAPDSGIIKYSFADYGLRFTEARPVRLNDSIWAIGSRTGAVAVNLARKSGDSHRRPVFTSVAIQNRPDSLLSASSDTIMLSKSERSITLRFAALEFNNPAGVEYFVSIDGDEWNSTGSTRSVTLLNLSPGTHTVAVRAIHSDGRPMSDSSTMTIIVEPRFSETIAARVLLIVAIIAVAAAILRTILYIRHIKRRQRETLEAYLRLLEPEEKPSSPAPPPGMSADDEALMDRIVRYVEQNITDADMSVDSLASAVATSRSTLVRKMKALLGVTPADFIRQSRLQRAAVMLRSTDLPVKHIASDCGFSDLNYFGKCFKSTYGSTPTAYRKNLSNDSEKS